VKRDGAVREKVILLAGGTDPSGGAGLPADIKTAAALGFHGCPAAAALTVQNSGNVHYWEPVSGDLFRSELEAVLEDGPVAAVKSGMLGSSVNALILSRVLKESLSGCPYVLDPVLAAGGGGSLTDGDMLNVLRESLIPLSAMCTPNLNEARIITGMQELETPKKMVEAGREILRMGAEAVLVKGGHLAGDPVDVLVTDGGVFRFSGSRLTEDNVHGTGCTLASAAAVYLAAGRTPESAVAGARSFLRGAISRRISRKHGLLPGHLALAGPPPLSPDGSSFYSSPVYCPACGVAMKKDPGEHGHLHCGECGHIHYRNPLPAVTLLVLKGSRLLLVERAVEPAKGMLCLPGGFMETGETVPECGARELFEETGLTAVNSHLFRILTDDTAYGGIVLAALRVTEFRGEARAGDDASRLFWIPLEEIPPLAFQAHDELVDLLRLEIGQA